MIYLDNAATSYPKPESVYQAVNHCMRHLGANPGRAGHQMAIGAGRLIYETRENLARLFNITNPMQIIFTVNATEALNLGIKGLLRPGDHVICSSMEHNSVIRPLRGLEKRGVETTVVQCSPEGLLDVADVEKAIRPTTRLMVVTHASNVAGTLMPVEALGELAHRHGITFMVDAAQSAGVYKIDVEAMHIDLLAFPGHKGLLGPQGTGGLYIREGLVLETMREGGTGSKSELEYQPEIVPDKYESGTPNTPGIAGLGAGVKFILATGEDKIRMHEEKLTARLIEGLQAIPKVKVYGPGDAQKQAGVVAFNIGDRDSAEIGFILDKVYNIAVRAGMHCSPLAHRTLGTLQQGAVRMSVGYFNTMEEIETALEAVREIAEEVE